MLQSTEYSLIRFWSWWARVDDFRTVEKRRSLDKTKRAKLLLLCGQLFVVTYLSACIVLAYLGKSSNKLTLSVISGCMLLFFPLILPIVMSLPLYIVRIFYVVPQQKRFIATSHTIFSKHPGRIIAVAGSYGKTTMKELLKQVLSEAFEVKATPGNMNVAISHARFAKTLSGDEQFVIVEFGEGRKNDVKTFTATIEPDLGIITGIAPNHLDEYGTLAELQNDLLTLIEFTGPENSFVNGENEILKAATITKAQQYSLREALGWTVSSIDISVEGTKFTMTKGSNSMNISSKLIGRHQVATLAFVAALANSLGMKEEAIESAMARTEAYEHRMQPRSIDGAWIIDDAYNGNIEGMKAGLALLSELSATGKKVYVTPGLVDQGVETKRVHEELGKMIGEANISHVVLMNNSVTEYIKAGIDQTGFKGNVSVVKDPLLYYTNLPHTVARGDIVMLQNDWTDNYA